MSNFPLAKLGDHVSFRTGKLDSNAATAHGAYPFFTCSRETLRTDTCSFNCEAVLLAGNNANGIYPIKYFVGEFDAYQRTYVIESTNIAVLGNRFLYFALTPLLRQLQSLSTGAATKFLTMGILKSLPIPLPLPHVQNRIAYILSAYDDLLENNTKRIKILEEMARSLYREWFINFRFPGHEKTNFVTTRVGKIPEGWRPCTLGELVDEIRDAVDPAELDPEIPYFGLEHLPRRSIALAEWGKASQVQSTKLRARAGDILFGKIRPYFHKVGPAPLDAVCSSDTIILRARDQETYGVALGCVSSDPFVEHSSQTSQGTKMPRANWSVLKMYPCPLPPSSLLSRFSEVMGDTVNLLQNLVLRNRNLSATRDLLLPRLISGEIDVSSLPLEPAAS